jgi:hypothetical protein
MHYSILRYRLNDKNFTIVMKCFETDFQSVLKQHSINVFNIKFPHCNDDQLLMVCSIVRTAGGGNCMAIETSHNMPVTTQAPTAIIKHIIAQCGLRDVIAVFHKTAFLGMGNITLYCLQIEQYGAEIKEKSHLLPGDMTFITFPADLPQHAK